MNSTVGLFFIYTQSQVQRCAHHTGATVMYRTITLVLILILFSITIPANATEIFDNTREVQGLKTEISELKEAIRQQNELLPELIQKINEIGNNSIVITEIWKYLGEIKDTNSETAKTLGKVDLGLNTIKDSVSNIANDSSTIKQSILYKDVFVFNKEGKPALYVDDIGLWLYKYNTNQLVGWIQPDTHVVYRNDDAAPIGYIYAGYFLDKRGYPLGVIERSEFFRKEREKNYQVLTRPLAPNLVLREQAPRQFFALARPASTWSIDNIDDLFFTSITSDKKPVSICSTCR